MFMGHVWKVVLQRQCRKESELSLEMLEPGQEIKASSLFKVSTTEGNDSISEEQFFTRRFILGLGFGERCVFNVL